MSAHGDVYHVPVMVEETLYWLNPRPGGVYVDCTLGGGGHAEALLEHPARVGLVLGLDRDPEAVAHAARRLSGFGARFRAVQSDFSRLESAAAGQGIEAADGVLMDLGVSSRQLTGGGRGFSFRADEPLDMRMDSGAGETAAEVVASRSRDQLAEILRAYGEERWARRIAQFIERERAVRPITTTAHLARVVEQAVPRGAWPPDTHVATRTFQALRIAVNNEIEELERGLQAAVDLLRVGGRVVVLSYHSLEDRVVKRRFGEAERGCVCPPRLPVCACGRRPTLKVLTRRPVTAGASEVQANPRARSAKLRAAERLAGEG